MTNESPHSADLNQHGGALEFIIHGVAAMMLVIKFWDVLPASQLIIFLSTVTGIGIFRLLSLWLSFRASQRSGEPPGWFAKVVLHFGALLAGLVWGSIPLALMHTANSALINEPAIVMAIVIVTVATLFGSFLLSSIYYFFTIPAACIPLSVNLYLNQYQEASIWGLFILVVMIASKNQKNLGSMATMFRQVSRGNTELMKNLTKARDEALRNQREIENANQAIKAEVEERHRAEQKIRQSEQELSRILYDMQDTFFRTDGEGKILRVSQSIEYLLGYSSEALIGKNILQLFHEQKQYEDIKQKLDKHFGIIQNAEVSLLHQAEHEVWVSINAHSYSDEMGKSVGVEGTMRDVTQTKRAAEALFQEKERLHVTLESIGDGVITTDVNGNVEYINPTGEAMCGWHTEEVKGKPLADIMYLRDEANEKNVQLPLEIWLKQGERLALSEPVLLIHRERQQYYAIELNGAPIQDSQQQVIGAVLVFHDVTRLRNLARQLSYQATHDDLTGLINRVEFDKRAEQAINSAMENEKVHALCYIDLDQFKVVNDTCGHHAGDELLKQITSLLQNSLRDSDVLARLGGDEFGVLLNGCPLDKAAEIAEGLRQQVEDFRFLWEGKDFRIGLSIGVVPINGDTTGLTELLSQADSACYVAKERGRNYVHVYEPDDKAVAEHHGQMQWMQRIQNALDNDLFDLYIHMIVPVKENTKPSFHGEILVRMIDDRKPPGENIIPPNAFIPAAERYHLMPQIDRWVIRNTFYALMEGNNITELEKCNINLSGQSIGDLKILDYILAMLKETGVPPSTLCFEITESAVIANLDVAKEFIAKLKKLGCEFALDDFGSGLSSFSYLKNLAVDYVKLDGSLVKDIATNKISQAMVHAINYVTHVMGIKSIAEFVSSEDILKSLRAIKVDYAQGYCIDKPQPFRRATHAGQKSVINKVKVS